ncbi:MAG TPA: tRNA (adenosine(37)-N6)-threonylcarbamoyltransferase complex dimerization subunit type 1 TsaB [Jatrophihabitans sp.]|nr:tRNA (adenosine(37)-N6)-threonylcarbamoyltransferase complex dimerization subunit type 1 TsaB [Jatrophihabitans sp.]
MQVLVIDTSTAAITAGVVRYTAVEPELLAEQVTVNGKAHGELLAPSIEAALAEAGLTVADLDAIVVGTGPGPFTGLRVGLVTAAALADARGIPAYGVCSLDGIAAQHSGVESLLVATDARRHEIYWAAYRFGARLVGPSVSKPAELPQDLVVSAAAGAGAELYREELGLPLVAGGYPRVLGLAGQASERVRARAVSDPLVPLYLRRPDAVPPKSLQR